jgi:hypothetical protein
MPSNGGEPPLDACTGGWLLIRCRDLDDGRALAARLREEQERMERRTGVASGVRVCGLIRRPRVSTPDHPSHDEPPSGRRPEGTRRGSR